MLEHANIPWQSIFAVVTTVGGYLLALVLIPRIILDRRESGATLAWILFIAIVPYLGVALFFLVGQSRVRRKSRKHKESHDIFLRNMNALDIKHPACNFEKPPEVLSEQAREIARLAASVTGTPVITGNSLEIFIDANKAYDRMQQAIEQAQHHVFMQSYIYRKDSAGKRFRDLLIEKAKEGVEVKLLVDGVGGQEISKKFIKPLLDAGGQFGIFMPVFGFRPYWNPNLRNHRKILIVDDKVGFAGGLNIGEEYQGRKKKYAPWRDTHIRLDGPAVGRLQEIFAEDWLFATDEDLADTDFFTGISSCGEELVQIVDSGPDKGHETIHAVFFTAVNEASEKVFITTPYFIPDSAMLLALKTASWRGVDVRILLPGKSDLRLVQWAGRSYYKELLQAGVRIFEHHPGMLHAKTMVVDKTWSTVGSANMDRRSFRLNFEVNVLISGSRMAERMEKIFYTDMDKAKEITLEDLEHKGLKARMVEAFARILSPVL